MQKAPEGKLRSQRFNNEIAAQTCVFRIIRHDLLETRSLSEMKIFQESWQARAKAKVAEIHSRIPKKWLLDQVDLEKAKNQRNLTGPFIESFLDAREVDIIRNDSLQLVQKIKSQHHTAVEVVQVYCRTAAIAQQIVG